MNRRDHAYSVRTLAAANERQRTNRETELRSNESDFENRIASYTKCLPHNDLGEVDSAAFDTLISAIEARDFAAFEHVPLGGSLRLAGPISGLFLGLTGPDSTSIDIETPPSFSSLKLAAEMAELYWMALLSDIPFADFDSSELVAEAIRDLSRFSADPSQTGPEPSLITPKNLFLADYPKVSDGPRVSQFLLLSYDFDGVTVDQRTNVPLSVAEQEGVSFLTAYEEWLSAQRGFPANTSPADPQIDPQLRYIRNMRDMGFYAGANSVLSPYIKAALITLGLGRQALDDANPYKQNKVLGGLGTFDFAHLMTLLGHVATAQHFSFHKWRHRLLRPEALGGRVHNHLKGQANYPLHNSLLHSGALERIHDHNAKINKRRNISDEGSFLLPCLFGEGCPTHPSYPAGHGVAAGIGVTLLKAWFKEDFILPDSMTVKPNRDGTKLEPYKAGQDGPPLTLEGELNKLAYNVTWGRNMSGVHFQSDGIAGNRLGEEIMVQILSELRNSYTEPFAGFTLTRFDGRKTTI